MNAPHGFSDRHSARQRSANIRIPRASRRGLPRAIHLEHVLIALVVGVVLVLGGLAWADVLGLR